MTDIYNLTPIKHPEPSGQVNCIDSMEVWVHKLLFAKHKNKSL